MVLSRKLPEPILFLTGSADFPRPDTQPLLGPSQSGRANSCSRGIPTYRGGGRARPGQRLPEELLRLEQRAAFLGVCWRRHELIRRPRADSLPQDSRMFAPVAR